MCAIFPRRRPPRRPASGPACAAGPRRPRGRPRGWEFGDRLARAAPDRRRRSRCRRVSKHWPRGSASAGASCGVCFIKHMGATPVAVAQTRRLHFAKKLIDETAASPDPGGIFGRLPQHPLVSTRPFKPSTGARRANCGASGRARAPDDPTNIVSGWPSGPRTTGRR